MQNQTDQNVSIPRVNKSTILNHVGADVRVVGKIVKIDVTANQLTLQTSDGGVLQVSMNNATKHNSDVVEILGKVNADGSLKELHSIDFPSNFGEQSVNYFLFLDLTNYDQLIQIMQVHKDIFGLA